MYGTDRTSHNQVCGHFYVISLDTVSLLLKGNAGVRLLDKLYLLEVHSSLGGGGGQWGNRRVESGAGPSANPPPPVQRRLRHSASLPCIVTG